MRASVGRTRRSKARRAESPRAAAADSDTWASLPDCSAVRSDNNEIRGWLSRARSIGSSRMAHVHRVGGDVDAFCTRSTTDLGHTILAMVATNPALVHGKG